MHKTEPERSVFVASLIATRINLLIANVIYSLRSYKSMFLSALLIINHPQNLFKTIFAYR